MNEQIVARVRPDLEGVRVVLFGLNLPGPAAAARLAAAGARVIKFEPPTGEPFAAMHHGWYEQMHAHIETRRVDLKSDAGREQLAHELSSADVFITAFRHASLERLALDHASLTRLYPRLCQVAIVGHGHDSADVAGHDLTYQAGSGLLLSDTTGALPPMPSTLLADLVGVERTVAAVYSLLFARERGHATRYAEVALADCAYDFGLPARLGLTARGGFLGGANPFYAMYQTADGVIALAALEEKFWRALVAALPQEPVVNGISPGSMTAATPELRATLQACFLRRTAREWEDWARAHDIPLAAIRPA
ncbi:MAG: CoA transferase [Gemmatimonas sp.]